MSLVVSAGSSKEVETLSSTYALWKHDPTNPKKCPGSIPFFCALPATFEDGGESFPLPPTYEATFLSVPGLVASCTYTLSVSVVKGLLLKGYWTDTKKCV